LGRKTKKKLQEEEAVIENAGFFCRNGFLFVPLQLQREAKSTQEAIKSSIQINYKMKKFLTIAVMAVMLTAPASAQEKDSQWTLNTRAWCTNYFTTVLYNLAQFTVSEFVFNGNEKDSLLVERIVPNADLVFPVGMGKEGINCYGPYHYAFGNPFKHIGDYAIGLDASFRPSFLGFYAGAYFKSQEVVEKSSKDNIRGFYFQPRAGITLGDKHAFEAGVFYDIVTGCGGSRADVKKDMLKGGLGLDFALSAKSKSGKSMAILQFSMPLHNFFDTDEVPGCKRKVGYIMLTRRVIL